MPPTVSTESSRPLTSMEKDKESGFDSKPVNSMKPHLIIDVRRIKKVGCLMQGSSSVVTTVLVLLRLLKMTNLC